MSKYDCTNRVCPVEGDNPAIRRYTGCIECGSCVRACRELAGVFGYYEVSDNAGKALCINCGQCAAVCVSFALQPRNAVNEIFDAMGEGKILVASMSPAVRVSVAEYFGWPEGSIAVDYPLLLPGNSHGRCITFGYLVGRELARSEEV